MKTVISSLFLLVFSFTTAHAQWWSSSEKVNGNGDVITTKRTVSEYDKVSLQGFMDVELVSGNEGNLSLEGESNLLEHIVTEVSNGTLKISVEKGVNLSPTRRNGIKITVPVESLEGVSLTGSGDIYSSERLTSEDFEVHVTGSGDIDLHLVSNRIKGSITGSGDINLKGTATQFECGVTGSGDFDASQLKAERVYAKVSGSGDISVHATDELKSRVTGSGDISYSGNPQKQDFKTSGSGSVSSR